MCNLKKREREREENALITEKILLSVDRMKKPEDWDVEIVLSNQEKWEEREEESKKTRTSQSQVKSNDD